MNIFQRRKFAKALSEYCPDNLARHLKRAKDGTVFVDRTSLITSSDEELKFCYVLNRDYFSGYDNIESLTAFFEPYDDYMIGGAYNPITGEKISRRRLISTSCNTPYTYTSEDFEKFKNIINNT